MRLIGPGNLDELVKGKTFPVIRRRKSFVMKRAKKNAKMQQNVLGSSEEEEKYIDVSFRCQI